MELGTNEASQSAPGMQVWEGPEEAISNLARLESSITVVIDKLRRLTAHPNARHRNILTQKTQAVCDTLGISANFLREHEHELPFPIAMSANGSHRTFRPEDVYNVRRYIGGGLQTDPEAPPVVVAIANQKGGVGKTTTAVTLAQDLACRGLKILFIDLDPQASATSSFLFEGTRGSGVMVEGSYAGLSIDATIAPIMLGDTADIGTLTRKTHWATIDLIPSTPDLIDAEVDMINQLIETRMEQERTGRRGVQAPFWTALRTALRGLKTTQYDVVLIDTPPSMSLASVAVTLASHGLLVPVPARNLDIESLRAFLRTNNNWLKVLAKHVRLDLRWVRFLTTMRKKDSKAEHLNEYTMRKAFPDEYLAEHVKRSEALQRSSGGAPSPYEEQPPKPVNHAPSAAACRRDLVRVYNEVYDLVGETYRAQGALVTEERENG